MNVSGIIAWSFFLSVHSILGENMKPGQRKARIYKVY